MTKEDVFRKVEDLISNNLRKDWNNLSIVINGIIYGIFLGYGTDNHGRAVLRAWLFIPDYDTAMKFFKALLDARK